MPREEGQAAGDFGIPEAAALVGWSTGRVRRLVRDGVLAPTRGPRGTLRLSFRDLTLLRRLRELGGERIAPRRVRSALLRLRAALPDAGALSGVALSASGREVVAREGGALFQPESGQCVFDFAPQPPRAERVIAFAPRAAAAAAATSAGAAATADAWVCVGDECGESDPARAREAYRAALELYPDHADAHVNLGCMEHEAGRLAEAERHYRAALAARPDDVTARFDLAVVLEDQRRRAEARAEYEALLAQDASHAEARHNLARLCERLGDRTAALRHWHAFRKLARED